MVEWFIDKGESIFTTWLYPSPDGNGLDFFTSGGAALFQEISNDKMRSIWDD
ncbi:GH32 C-terminal domain-containing protein [Bacillus sp. FJAT-28004]|uniref:GH32 C-terminal domain-containing protein n=1 Tax=Bacillus sp. FJAT-28004 TaxID=1679165 RepID=UPI00137921CE